MSISYLNGVWQPVEDARISVRDRGFLFGDGIYEVIPVYNRQAFTLARHLKRLATSLEEIKLENPLSTDAWDSLIAEAIEKSGETTASLYLQITRGADVKRIHIYPEKVVPTIFVMVSPLPATRDIYPYEVITLDDYRWSKGFIKTVSLIAACMLKNEAISRGANDAILLKGGMVTEATSSNVFMVLDGVIVTPPKSQHLLFGITRDVVIELARGHKMPLQERDFTLVELMRASEIFVTSSTHEAWPVGKLNGTMVGNGEGGIVWQEIDRLFQAFKQQA